MFDRRNPRNASQQEVLLDQWLDSLNDPTRHPPPVPPEISALAGTARRYHDLLGMKFEVVPSTMPDSVKHVFREDLMHAQPATESPVAERQGVTPGPIVIPSLRGSGRGIYGTRSAPGSVFVRAVMRWQPAVSLAVVVAFLLGLVGFAYQRGVLDEPAPPAPGAANQAIPEDYNPRETPVVSDDCVPHGPRRLANAELEGMALADWQDPIYVPAGPVPAEIGEAALDTYLGWFMCERQFWYDGGTPDVYASEHMLSYYSDRWQYITLAPSFADPREDQIAQYWRDNEAHIEEIIAGFPLPLNRVSYYILEDTRVHYPGFEPGDVYRLPDDRYGVVIGTITTDMLQTGQPTDFGDGYLWFVAFEEYDGKLYIDEHFAFCVGDKTRLLNEDGTVATPGTATDGFEGEEVVLACR